MLDLLKFLLCSVMLIAQANSICAQLDKGNPQAPFKSLKWQPVAGKNNEFLAYLPEGHEAIADGNFKTGESRARVEKKIVVWRYLNGVALIVEYYEGDAEGILKSMISREKSPAEKNEVVNAFTFLQFSGPLRTYFSKKQFFRYKDRLYVAKAIAKSADDKILKDFFNSVTLVNEKVVIFPNLEKSAKSVRLADIAEQQPPLAYDALVIESKDADRGPAMLYTQRPKFPRNGSRGSDEKIKVKLLLSATGRVSSVDVVGKAPKSFSDAAVEAAKKTRFIPAEKGGKPVSVYQTQEFSFNSY